MNKLLFACLLIAASLILNYSAGKTTFSVLNTAVLEAQPAQGGGQGGPGGPMMFSPEDRFKQMDKNNDGKLTLKEYKASMEEFQKRMKDMQGGMGPGNGGQGQMPQRAQIKPEERFKQMDANNDGKVTLEEYKKDMESRRPRGGFGGQGGGFGATPAK